MNFKVVNEKFFLFPFFVLLVVGVILPTDAKHGLFSAKSLAYLLSLAGVFLLALLKRKIFLSSLQLFCFFGFSACFFLVWFLFGLLFDDSLTPSRIDQMKLFIITISIPLITYYYLHEGKISPRKLINLLIFANLTYCTTKIILILAHLAGVINIWTLLRTTGFSIHKMTIFGELSRLQTSVDITAPFLVFFALQSEALGLDLSRRVRSLYLAASFFSTIFAFSRFLFAVYFLSVALHVFTLKPLKIAKAAVSLILLAMLFTFSIGMKNTATAINARFFSRENTISDEIRVQQVQALMRQFYESPYLGQGMGGYAKDVIRDRNNLHSYEVQWVAFLMQFGIIGMSILLIPIFWIYFKLLTLPLNRNTLALTALFSAWLLSGFTNPFLISLQSGILYTLFLLGAEAVDRRFQWRCSIQGVS